MVELTFEKIMLLSIGVVFALIIGIPLITWVLDAIRLYINGLG